MKAKNNKEVTRAYWRFSIFLAGCIAVGILTFYTFMRTSAVEVNKIVEKTEEYDKIYARQLDLVNKIDVLYDYTVKLNTNLNDVQIQNTVSNLRLDIAKSMDNMSNRDVRLFRKLVSETSGFLAMKDSIKIKRNEEGMVRDDLSRCIEKSKQTTRDIAFGRINRR